MRPSSALRTRTDCWAEAEGVDPCRSSTDRDKQKYSLLPIRFPLAGADGHIVLVDACNRRVLCMSCQRHQPCLAREWCRLEPEFLTVFVSSLSLSQPLAINFVLLLIRHSSTAESSLTFSALVHVDCGPWNPPCDKYIMKHTVGSLGQANAGFYTLCDENKDTLTSLSFFLPGVRVGQRPTSHRPAA